MVLLAVQGEKLSGRPAIDPKVAAEFRNRLSKLIESDKTPDNAIFSPLEMAVAQMLWNGNNKIWDYLHKSSYYMARAAASDPEAFFRYIRELGLDLVLPFFRGLTAVEKDLIGNYLAKENEEDHQNGLTKLQEAIAIAVPDRKTILFQDAISFASTAFDFAPHISEYYNHQPGKEFEQSDEYFMQVCEALAYFALENNQEPFAAIVVKNGKIISATHNEVNLRDGKKDHKRHAEILAMERAAEILKDESLKGCIVYSSCTPCQQCAYQLRKYTDIEKVICGIDRVKSGVEILLDPDSKDTDDAGDPLTVIIGILEEQFRELYLDKMHWNKMIRYVGKIREFIPGNSSHYQPRIYKFRDELLEPPAGIATFQGEEM